MQGAAVFLLQEAQQRWRLTIVGGGREAWFVWRRGRWKTVCARGADRALLCGPSTSPLGGAYALSRVTMSPLTAYADLMDGLRSYYAGREDDNASASLTAVSLLSTLFIANVSGAVLVTNQVLHGGTVTLAPWVHGNRGAVVLGALSIVALHWLFAKITGVYDRRGKAAPPEWARRFRVYLLSSICIFSLPVMIAVVRHYR